MDLKYLYTFKTIADEGSFTKAAEKLCYTQSAITFQIGQLEQELSVCLFEKIGRRMTLTKAGENLLPYVENILQSVDKLRFAQEDLAQCRGELKIGVAETQLCYKMPEILKEFHEKAPNAKLSIRSMNCYEIRNEIIGGTLDLGVFYKDVGGFGGNLTSYTLGDYPLVLVASAETKERFPDFVTPEQTLAVPFIINEPNCIFRQIFEEYLRKKSIVLDGTVELWSIPTIINLVKSNMGVSFLPEFTVRRELERGELFEIETDISGTSVTAAAAHHRNKWVSPLMRAFLDCCKNNSYAQNT